MTYSFTIEFNIEPSITDPSGGLSDAALETLFTAGCDDGTFGVTAGVNYVVFDREATSAGHALASAMMDMRSVKGIEITDIQFEREGPGG